MSNSMNENLALKSIIFAGAVAEIDQFVFKEEFLFKVQRPNKTKTGKRRH